MLVVVALCIISFIIAFFFDLTWINVAFFVGAISLLFSTSGTATEAHLAMKTLGNYVPKNGAKLVELSPLLVGSLSLLVISFLIAVLK
ncbi:hypothetical protein [Halalkalibacter krulwichiae]|uniref:Uncharacterized protein n=2 Tax=Halalkalibacter krulwichiae TaxID=199441 RepID=A0A1X9MB07_9BACI|nr:hypothetical protein [Halalkalibacter krulwichiae]ARK30588.1 hypothetical protein BkAM31D_12525 [Halalkalibacter krulwichiae]